MLKIDDVMRQIRIQHLKIILEPLLDKFYSKMPWGVLLRFFLTFGSWLKIFLAINLEFVNHSKNQNFASG